MTSLVAPTWGAIVFVPLVTDPNKILFSCERFITTRLSNCGLKGPIFHDTSQTDLNPSVACSRVAQSNESIAFLRPSEASILSNANRRMNQSENLNCGGSPFQKRLLRHLRRRLTPNSGRRKDQNTLIS